MMRKIFILTVLLCAVALTAAMAEECSLVDGSGNPVEGFSKAYVVNGKGQPVYSFNDGMWYSTIPMGTDDAGNCLVRLGLPFPRGEDKEGEGCFAGDTLIWMADGSYKEIREIEAGDLVRGYDFENNEVVVVMVEEAYSVVRDHYFIINGGLEVTAEHPFYAQDFGWTEVSTGNVIKRDNSIEAQDLKPKDVIFGLGDGETNTLQRIPVESVRRVDEPGVFYNIIVGGAKNFFVYDVAQSIQAEIKTEMKIPVRVKGSIPTVE
jgi:hypothetical protein